MGYIRHNPATLRPCLSECLSPIVNPLPANQDDSRFQPIFLADQFTVTRNEKKIKYQNL